MWVVDSMRLYESMNIWLQLNWKLLKRQLSKLWPNLKVLTFQNYWTIKVYFRPYPCQWARRSHVDVVTILPSSVNYFLKIFWQNILTKANPSKWVNSSSHRQRWQSWQGLRAQIKHHMENKFWWKLAVSANLMPICHCIFAKLGKSGWRCWGGREGCNTRTIQSCQESAHVEAVMTPLNPDWQQNFAKISFLTLWSCFFVAKK